MPPHSWVTAPMTFAQRLEAKVPAPDPRREASALIVHATWAVDALHYQVDLDAMSLAQKSLGHDPDSTSLAHMRWASGTAVTALDLCAAALGRFYCGVSGPHEFDIRSFDATGKNPAPKLAEMAKLPSGGQAWIGAVIADPRYRGLQQRTRAAAWLLRDIGAPRSPMPFAHKGPGATSRSSRRRRAGN